MQRPPVSDINIFTRQMEAMYARLSHLYSQVDGASAAQAEILPVALKELGVAAEELQVASEELQQQHDQMATSLESASVEAHYAQLLFDNAAQAQFATTLDGKIQTVNRAAARLLKMSQSNLVDRLLIRFVPADDRSLFRLQMNQLQQLQRPQMWMGRLQSAEGKVLPLTFSASIIGGGNGSEPIVHWLLQDTSQLQATLIKPSASENLSQDERTADWAAVLESPPHDRYDKGDIISFSPHSIWYVVQGLVKLTTLSENNEEILLGLVGAGMPFGMGSVSLFTYQATALTDVRLVSLPLAEVGAHSALAEILLTKFEQRLQQTEALLNVIGQRRAKDRLHYLLQLLKREIGQPLGDGICLTVRLTHEDLANACGTTRVTITRLLGRLQREGKIAFDQRSHIILNSNF